VSRWRPSPDEERWLEVASDLGAAVPRAAVAERTGGWRNTGPLARVALFVLGLIAAVLLFGIIGVGSKANLLVAGLIAAVAAEWLTVEKRLHASGIEEGLCVAGFLLIGAWITTLFEGGPRFAGGSVETLVLIAAVAAAGLRLLNPLVTTGAVLAFVDWAGSTSTARALDQAIGDGLTGLTLGVVLAALALALGAREYRRPSHDRMLDWLVATLPIAAYAQHANWSVYTLMHFQGGPGTGRVAAVVLLLALGTAMLLVGLRRRRHAPLLGFMGCVACLAVELRLATTLATETWLIIYGLAAMVAGVALEPRSRRPPGPPSLLAGGSSAAVAPAATTESTRQVTHGRSTIGLGVPAPMTPFGFGPNRFPPGWLSSTASTMITMEPMTGMKLTRNHHPLRFVSCSRRTVTAMLGINTASRYTPPNRPISACSLNVPTAMSTTVSTTTARKLNSMKNQYSLRRARPSNVAYFLSASMYQFIGTPLLCSDATTTDTR